MNKKAIAPLISTVVLIFFAVALGLIVMNWGSTASYATETKLGCDKAGLNVIEINGKADMCFKNNNLYFTLENDGEAAIDGLRVSFIGEYIYQIDLREKIFVGDIKKVNAEYEDVGMLLKVKIAPIMGGEVCVKQSIGIEKIEAC